jgi:hypothetical protein
MEWSATGYWEANDAKQNLNDMGNVTAPVFGTPDRTGSQPP